MAGVTLHECRNVQGVETILRQQGNTGRNRSMWEHVFPFVFPEPVPGTLWGKPIAVFFPLSFGEKILTILVNVWKFVLTCHVYIRESLSGWENCAGNTNNSRCGIDVTAKPICEHLVLVLGPRGFRHHAFRAHTPTVHSATIPGFPCSFSQGDFFLKRSSTTRFIWSLQ